MTTAELYDNASAEAMRAELAVRKLSGRKLAALMGSSPASVARLLSGERRASVGDVAAVASAIGMEPVALLEAAIARADGVDR